MTLTTELPTQLSALMREGSRSEHEAAEGSNFMEELLAGRLSPTGYVDYLVRLRSIYATMEAIGHELVDDPVASVVLDPALERLAALEADISYWAARAGVDVPTVESPAVDSYVARLKETANWGGLFIAHHYTRYLGDLSGGQAIAKILSRAYELDGAGVAFYEFPQIEKLKVYKDNYRAALDSLPLPESDRFRVLDEVKIAFNLNQALFEELTEKLTEELLPNP